LSRLARWRPRVTLFAVVFALVAALTAGGVAVAATATPPATATAAAKARAAAKAKARAAACTRAKSKRVSARQRRASAVLCARLSRKATKAPRKSEPAPAPPPAPAPAPAPTTEPAPAPAPAPAPVAEPAPVPAPAPTPTTTSPTTTAPSGGATSPTGASAIPAPSAPSIAGRTYYVSPSGADTNSGTSLTSPWRTIARVNSASLAPGDGVLFLGGATFSDTHLMPRSSGTSGSPIVFGSYGTGEAVIAKGVWFASKSWLTFDNLAVNADGISSSSSGTGATNVTIQNSTISRTSGTGIIAPQAGDRNWTIAGNTIDGTGDSGIILLGDGHRISGNTILNTGLNTQLGWETHGIYLKSSNSQVRFNTIRRFAWDAVSVRFPNSVVERNTMSEGRIGIAWFQNDGTAGTSYWRDNVISQTTDASIYVSPRDSAGPTLESFVITGNTMSKTSGEYMDLRTTTGTYTLADNRTV
jgi:hypothetical protein